MSGWVRGPANFATGIHFGALRGAGNSRWQVPKASADQGSAVGGGGNSARPVSVDLGAWGSITVLRTLLEFPFPLANSSSFSSQPCFGKTGSAYKVSIYTGYAENIRPHMVVCKGVYIII